MSQVAFTTVPMMSDLMNMQSTLNVCEYESSATMSSVPSPSMFSTSSPDTRDTFFSPEAYMVISPEALGLTVSLGGPYLEILEQPVDKFRFRYKSEMMGTHGSILAKSTDKSRRRLYPTVVLRNYSGKAIVRCSLYTAHPIKEKRSPHTHRLVVRVGNEDKDDPHEIRVSADNKYTAVFQGMGIIHTAKRHIVDELIRKKRTRKLQQVRQNNMNVTSLLTREETDIRTEAEVEAKSMNLNSVTLCFEAFEECPGGVLKPICEPVYSSPINNMKSALTGELKICRIDKHTSSCLGGEEVFILVEKVGKKNIKIKFFELDDEDNEIWCDYGKFSELDVHHQYAIVFRTPPYRDTEIDKVVNVYLQLYRPTDGDCSEPIQFAYKPSEKTGRKRQRMSFNDSLTRYLLQENDLARGIVNLEMSDNPSFSGIETISSSFEDMLHDSRISSTEFNEFMQKFSHSGNFDDYIRALPDGSQDMTSRLPVNCLTTDSVSNRLQNSSDRRSSDTSLLGKNSRPSSVDNTHVKKELDEASLAWQIVDEIKRNASLKKPVFTERVLKMFNLKSEKGNCALHAAVIHRQNGLLKDMLTILAREPQRSILNCCNDKRQTPLHIAAAEQALSVKWLLNAGADPDLQDEDGNTPLHVAVKCSANDCVDEILSQSNYRLDVKADLNKRNSSGWTPLHLAVIHKNQEAIQKLVLAGANVNEEDANSRTALHIAAEENAVAIATYLVEHTNIDINKKDMTGYTALERARASMDRKCSPQWYDLLAHTQVEPQMETSNIELDLTRIKTEPDDSDNELQIDEDDEEDEDEEEDGSGHSDEISSTLQVDAEHKHILSLLQGVADSPKRQIKSPEITEVKEEMLASPLSECTIPDENGLFNAETLSQLCDILDATGRWADLAELLDYNLLIPSIRDAPSPSKLLFSYADIDGNVTVLEIRNFLEVLDEHKAVELVDLMLASRDC